jgi:hypothetical protein
LADDLADRRGEIGEGDDHVTQLHTVARVDMGGTSG